MYLPTLLPILLSLVITPCLANDNTGGLDHASITALPPAERQSAYINTDPDSKVRIWTERIEQYRDMHHDLSPNQREVLKRIVRGVEQHVDAMKTGEEEALKEDLQQISDDAIAAFDIDEAALILSPSLQRLDGKDGGRSLNVIHSSPAAGASLPCTCGGWPTCVTGKCYSDAESSCEHTKHGCGAGLWFACTGICVKAEGP